MTMSINGTNGLTFNDASTQNTAATGFGFKNRLINGAMAIDQRNAGASISVTSALVFPVDRMQTIIQAATGSTAQRSTNAPAGFVNSLATTVGTGASPTAAQQGRILQIIEGFNVADLAWGTASAATVTLSFWVQSSITGTFAGGLYGAQGYVFTYVINNANTWEYKTVTIPGSTSGAWVTNNAAGINVNFDLGSGTNYQATAGSWGAVAAWATSTSVKLCATSGATFYITGVQLEKGSTATSFDYRPYGTELALCQRYLPAIGFSADYFAGQCASTVLAYIAIPFKVSTRVAPTGITTGTVASMNTTATNGAPIALTSIAFTSAGTESGLISLIVASGLIAGQTTLFNPNSQKVLFTGCEL